MNDKNNILSDFSDSQKKHTIEKLWNDIKTSGDLTAQQSPKAYMIGGQPGAGKSTSTEKLEEQYHYNILKIDMDDYREFHPNYEKINAVYGKDASQQTNKFAAEVRDEMMKRALDNKYNVIIDGTMKSHALAEKQINQLEKAGYSVEARIHTCPKEVSLQSIESRYQQALTKGKPPRYVPKEFHDSVLIELPKTIDKLYQSGKTKIVEVHNRQEKIYDSRVDKGLPSVIIQAEINKNNKQLSKNTPTQSANDAFAKARQAATKTLESKRSQSTQKTVNKGMGKGIER